MRPEEQLEKNDPVAQKRADLLRFIRGHADLFGRRGSVHASWRRYHGKQLGPFFRLSVRQGRKQRSRYLGTDRAFALEVHNLLRELQAPLRQQRDLQRQLGQVRQGFQERKRAFGRQRARQGLYWRGSEIHGWWTRRAGCQPANCDTERGLNNENNA